MLVRQCGAVRAAPGQEQFQSISQLVSYINLAPKNQYFLRVIEKPQKPGSDAKDELGMIVTEISGKLESLSMLFVDESNKFFKTKKKLELWEIVDWSFQISEAAVGLFSPGSEFPFKRHRTKLVFKIFFEEEVGECDEFSENYQDILNGHLDLLSDPVYYLQNFLRNASKMVDRKTEMALQMFQTIISAQTRSYVIELYNDKMVFLLVNLLAKVLPKLFQSQQTAFEMTQRDVQTVLDFEGFEGAFLKSTDFDESKLQGLLKGFLELRSILTEIKQKRTKEECSKALRLIHDMQIDFLDLRRFVEVVLKNIVTVVDEKKFIEHYNREKLIELL